MSALTLLLALFAWLLGPFAPPVPFAQVGVIAVAGAFWLYESDTTGEVRAIEEPAPPADEAECFEEPEGGRGEAEAGCGADPVLKDRAENGKDAEAP